VSERARRSKTARSDAVSTGETLELFQITEHPSVMAGLVPAIHVLILVML
jgi:hypothetical protein